MLNNPQNNQQQFNNDDDDNDRNLNAATSTVAAPPPPPSKTTTNLKSAKSTTSRAAMFDQIIKPTKLRKTTITNDKSAPILGKASVQDAQPNPNEPKFEDRNSKLSAKEIISKLSADKKPLQSFEDSDDKKLGRKIESIINLEDDLKSKTLQNSLEAQEKLLSTKIANIEAHFTELTNAIAARKNHNSGLNHLLRELSETNLTRDDNFSEITSIRKKLDSENTKLAEAQKDLSAEWENLRKTTAKACLAANQARIDTNTKSISKATIEAKTLIKSVYQYGDITSSSSSTEEDDKNVETKFQELTYKQRVLKAAKTVKNKKTFTNDSGVINKEVMIAELLDITANFPAELDEFTKKVRKSIEEAVNTPKVMPTNIDDLHLEIARLRKRIAELEASGKTQDAATVQQMVANLESSVQLAQSDNKVLQKLALLDGLTKQIADQAKELERLKAIENENEILQEQTKRAINEVESHKLAATKLQQDAQNLKNENEHLLSELKARREDIQALTATNEQNKTTLATTTAKLSAAIAKATEEENSRKYWHNKSDAMAAKLQEKTDIISNNARAINALNLRANRSLWTHFVEEASTALGSLGTALTSRSFLNLRANRSLWTHFVEEASTALGSLGTALTSRSFLICTLTLECVLIWDMMFGKEGVPPILQLTQPMFSPLEPYLNTQTSKMFVMSLPFVFSGALALNNSRSSCELVSKFLASSAIMVCATAMDISFALNDLKVPNILMLGALIPSLDVIAGAKSTQATKYMADVLVSASAYSYLMLSSNSSYSSHIYGLLSNFGNALAVTASIAYGKGMLDNTASPEAKILASAIVVGASTAALSYFGCLNPLLAAGTFATSLAISSLRDRSQQAAEMAR